MPPARFRYRNDKWYVLQPDQDDWDELPKGMPPSEWLQLTEEER